MKKNGHNIFIKNEQDKEEVTRELKSLICLSVAGSLEYEGFGEKAEVSVTFTDNEKIRELNREYRGIDNATDVLSFPLFDDMPDGGYIALGDIVISLERARKQSEEYGHSDKRELAFLVAHSMLHLFGYDHMEENDRAIMEQLQRDILTKKGYTRDYE